MRTHDWIICAEGGSVGYAQLLLSFPEKEPDWIELCGQYVAVGRRKLKSGAWSKREVLHSFESYTWITKGGANSSASG